MKTRKISVLMLALCMIFVSLAGCGKKSENTEEKETLTALEPETTQEETTPEETTPEETTPEETIPEETTAEEYVGAWTLLQQVTLNPKSSGYEELDNLVNSLIAGIVTEDMNQYEMVWACYEWMIDHITYSRGMDANTGAYSYSDPATTPKEVLWATDLLNSGQGCCYNYSATFMFIMRALGFDAHLCTGEVPAYDGGTTPHCWMYVNIGDTRYTFDPDLDQNYYNRGDNDEKNLWFCLRWDKGEYFYYLGEDQGQFYEG